MNIHSILSIPYYSFIGAIFIFISACSGGRMDLPQEVATLDTPSLSPTGIYKLQIVAGKDIVQDRQEDWQYFQILSNLNEVLFTSPDKFYVQHTTYFLWGDHDRVWVYSGDLGTFFWEFDESTASWQKFVYAENDVSAPAFLKQVRPKWHKK